MPVSIRARRVSRGSGDTTQRCPRHVLTTGRLKKYRRRIVDYFDAGAFMNVVLEDVDVEGKSTK